MFIYKVKKVKKERKKGLTKSGNGDIMDKLSRERVRQPGG